MPRASNRLQAKKQKEKRKPPPTTENIQNSSDTAEPVTQLFQQEDLNDASIIPPPTRLDPNGDGHNAPLPVGEHGIEQRNVIVGLISAGLGNLTAAAGCSTDELDRNPPPHANHASIPLLHNPGTPGSSTQRPAGLKATGLESDQEVVDDDRTLLQNVSRVGSFDDLDIHEQENTEGASIPPPPPTPAVDKFPATICLSAAQVKAPPLLLAPRPLPAGNEGILNRRGAFQMLPKTTGKGTGQKRGPYKEKLRESCTNTNPSQSSTISIKLNRPLQQFQQTSVLVSHPDPISEKFSATGGQGSYSNTNSEYQCSNDGSVEERVIWSSIPYPAEDEKEDIVTQAAKRHKRDDDDGAGNGENGNHGLGHVELTAEV